MAKIDTVGDLRKFLADTIDKVERGDIDDAKARNIAKLAAQINNAFYSEAKIMVIAWQMRSHVFPLGDLPMKVDKDAPRIEFKERKL